MIYFLNGCTFSLKLKYPMCVESSNILQAMSIQDSGFIHIDIRLHVFSKKMENTVFRFALRVEQ